MTVKPGWYKDPAEPSTQRYWDGAGWVGAPIPADAAPPPGPPATAEAPPPPGPPPPAAEQMVKAPAPRRFEPGLPPGPPVPVRPHDMPLAGMGARFVARVIDFGVVLLLNAVVNGWFVYQWMLDFIPFFQATLRAVYAGESTSDITPPDRVGQLLFVISILAMALWFAYEVPMIADSGQTLGKRALQIKVVRVESQEPLGFMRAWRRWNPLGMPVILASCCGPFFVILQILDVMFIPMDRAQRMALHDRSAGTYVVQLPPQQKGTQ